MAIRDDSEVYSCDITPHGKARRIYTSRTPVLGCISAITPFNHPLNMISHKIAPAIATNNRVVAKPTELTPLTALLLADILYEAGLPPEMLSIVTGNPATMGDAMITDPHADIVTFTGCVRVGKYIADKAGYKRLVLELGGNDPLIVMEDADLDKAAELAVQGATKNSGQRCTAVKRILVVESVADGFAEIVLAKARKLKCGDPMDPETDVGTVIHERAARQFEARVNAAVEEGASLLHGNDRKGALYPPTVVDHVPYECRAGARGDLRAGHPHHPLPGRHRGGHPHLELDRLRSVIWRLHKSARLHHPLHQRAGGRHRQHLGGAGLSHRDEPVRRHQGFRPGLQGRRVGGHEELHQRQDLLAALAGLRQRASVCHTQGVVSMSGKASEDHRGRGPAGGGVRAAGRGAEDQAHRLHGDRERPARAFKQAIEAAVPEVEVEWVRDSTGVITARFLAEKDNPRADIVLGLAASSLLLFEKAGLLETYKPKGAEALKPAFRVAAPPNLDRHGRLPRRHLLQHGRRPEGRLTPPTSWKDLTDANTRARS